jgi:hypothetical protein
MKFKNSLWGVYNKEREEYDNFYGEMIRVRDEIYDRLG